MPQVLTSLSRIGIKAADASSSPHAQSSQEELDSASPGGNVEGPSDSLIADANITLRTLEREVPFARDSMRKLACTLLMHQLMPQPCLAWHCCWAASQTIEGGHAGCKGYRVLACPVV